MTRKSIAVAVALVAFAIPTTAWAGAVQPPTDLTATGGPTSVRLDWTASTSSSVTQYWIYRQENGKWPTTPLAEVPASTVTFTDTELTPGQPYYYKMLAIGAKASDKSKWTPVVSAVPTAPPPPPPPSTCPPNSNYSNDVAGTASLTAYYRLGDASASKLCDALSANTGSYEGTVALGTAGAIYNDPDTAASFDGSTGDGLVPDTAALHVGDTFSVEAWIKRAATNDGYNMAIASKQSGDFVLLLNANGNLVLRRSGVADVAATTAAITDTGWHHVVATKDGSSVHLYIDGRDYTGPVSNTTMADNTSALTIGSSGTASRFHGMIDELAIYDSPITPAQVLEHYQVGTTGSSSGTDSASACPAASYYSTDVVQTSGTAGYWRLGDLTPATACDTTGGPSGTYNTGVTVGVPGALTGDSDTAATFDGSSGNVDVPSSIPLNVGDSLSVAAWIKRAGPSENYAMAIVSKQSGSFVLEINAADQLVLRKSGTADIVASTTTIADTAWHFVAATKNGSDVHLYIDGKDVTGTITNYTLSDNALDLTIGSSGSSSHFHGTIDDVSLSDAVWTADKVAELYNVGVTGNPPPPPPAPAPPPDPTQNSTDPLIAAAGDIACSPTDAGYNGGAGLADECQQRATSDLLTSGAFSAVLALGDTQYDNGALTDYKAVYDPTWGRVRAITHPVVGNHEYGTTSASGYFDYFDGVKVSNGAAGPRGKGWYSFDVGTWHIVALNSECSRVGGCQVGSAQEKWLVADLAAHPAKCTLAYWHRPLFNSSSGGVATDMQPIWDDLYKAGADVVLDGHAHNYERFPPLRSDGTQDPNGLRQFTVGTGGEDHEWTQKDPLSEVINGDTFGILKLRLHSDSYDWKFVPAAGGTFTDYGSASCH